MQGSTQLILGTSKLGELSKSESYKLLDASLGLGIQYIDTAPTYPKSEKLIGNFIGHTNKINVITKFGRESTFLKTDEMFDSIRSSCKKLKLETLYALVIHNRPSSAFDEKLLEYSIKLKHAGVIRYFGWSGGWQNLPKSKYFKYFDFVMVPTNQFIPNLENKIKTVKTTVIGMNPFANFFWNYKAYNPILKFYRERLLKKYNPKPPYKFESNFHKPPELQEMLNFLNTLKRVDGICFGSTKINHIREVVSRFG
jgi:hypothetical protein